MVARKAAKKAAPKRAKPVPRTKGTPDKPPKPRPVVKRAPSKPGRANAAGAKPALVADPVPPSAPAAPSASSAKDDLEVPAGWLPATEPTPQGLSVPEAPSTSPRREALRQAAKPFDPATGAWIPVPDPLAATPPAAADPAGYRPGVPSILLHILLGLNLALLVGAMLYSLATGAALLFWPDSQLAEQARDAVQDATPQGIAFNTALNLVLFGLIPFVWILGTRIRPVPGAWRYLQLRFQGRDWLRGLALVPAMLLVVALLSVTYILLTQGPEGLRGGDTGENPAVDAIVANLSWPLALFIALGAGIGEELFFRGFLQRYVGVWGQGILFGLAHASGGYVPQILFAAGLGVAFGFLLKRGWSLWSLMLAHFLYDFALLSLALAFPEFG